MENNEMKYYEIGKDKDNPLYKIAYKQEEKAIKKDGNKIHFGWQYRNGSVTNNKNKTIDFKEEFSAFDASLEYLFDVIQHGIINGPFGGLIESLKNTNIGLSTKYTAKTNDKNGHEIKYSIDAIAGCIPYNISILEVDGKDFNGKLPDKIEEHIYNFNDLNNSLKNIRRVKTYDKPNYLHSGAYEEMFNLEELIKEENIEINNEISKKLEVSLDKKKYSECEYKLDEYIINEKSYESKIKKKDNKISIGNIEQYQSVKKGNEELNFTHTYNVVEYDSKILKKHGSDVIKNNFLNNFATTMLSNFIKNLSFSTNVASTFEDKNGNIVEANLKLIAGNYLYSMQINKINGKEVTKIPKELNDMLKEVNKPFSGIKYYKETNLTEEERSLLNNAIKKSFKMTIDRLFEIKEKVKEIDVTNKENLEYLTDYNLKPINRILKNIEFSNREIKDVKIRTEKGTFTRVDKATFKTADNHDVEIKISSFKNGAFPVFKINSIDNEKVNVLNPLNIHLKGKSIDNLIITAKETIEKSYIKENSKEILSKTEEEKISEITNLQLSKVSDKILETIGLEETKETNILNKLLLKITNKFSEKLNDKINEKILNDSISDNIHVMEYDGRLTKEMIEMFYNKNPNLETIINNGNKINVMDYIYETLDEKIDNKKIEMESERNNLQVKKTQNINKGEER